MDLIKLSSLIESKINALKKMRGELRQRAIDKSETISEYEKQIALTIIKLKNGESFDFEGQIIINPPTTITEKIAKGICWEHKLKSEQAEALYKSLIVNIETVKAELNGYQSIIRYLDEK